MDEVVRQATHKTKRQTEELAVSIVPKKATAPGLRKAPVPRTGSEPGLALRAPSPVMELTTTSSAAAPAPSSPPPGKRAKPTAVTRRIVLKRDDYRCTWPYPDGSRCECTRRLELDYISGTRGYDLARPAP